MRTGTTTQGAWATDNMARAMAGERKADTLPWDCGRIRSKQLVHDRTILFIFFPNIKATDRTLHSLTHHHDTPRVPRQWQVTAVWMSLWGPHLDLLAKLPDHIEVDLAPQRAVALPV